MHPRYLIGVSLELAFTALFATVFTYFALIIYHKVRGTQMPKHHLFNNKELFLTSFFTAMIAFVLLKIFDWKDVFYQHHQAIFY